MPDGAWSCPSTISVRLPGTVPGLFCWGREGCWPRGPPGDVLKEERLEAAYGVPFLVREQEGELTVRVRRDPDREAREEKWLEQILENREA